MTTGRENLGGSLPGEDVAAVVAEALADRQWLRSSVLVLVPDGTRKAPIESLFACLYGEIGHAVRRLDVLVATGTHRPVGPREIRARIGADRAGLYPNVGLFSHVYDDPEQLKSVGTIPSADMAGMTGGLYSEDLEVTLNRRLFEYDAVIILGPVSPHESAGFAGGNKYLIPGAAGAEVTSAFHWLAALITNPAINGIIDNPARRVLDYGAGLAGLDVLCFSFVVREEDEGLGCLWAGPPRESWRRAAEYSARYHIVRTSRAYALIVGVAPAYLDDLWVGGKVMYKHEPILEDGGELVIYGPHITELSFTHGALIRQLGYHVRDYFLDQWDRFGDYPRLVLAHSANVRGLGTWEGGIERARVRVTLATGIPEDVCRSVGLGYRDPKALDVSEYRNREDEGTLVVDPAGQSLYRLAPGL